MLALNGVSAGPRRNAHRTHDLAFALLDFNHDSRPPAPYHAWTGIRPRVFLCSRPLSVLRLMFLFILIFSTLILAPFRTRLVQCLALRKFSWPLRPQCRLQESALPPIKAAASGPLGAAGRS